MRIFIRYLRRSLVIPSGIILLVLGCAGGGALIGGGGSDVDPGVRLDQYRLLRDIPLTEYIRGAPQDELTVPEGQDLVLRVDPLVKHQPASSNVSLIQVSLRGRPQTEASIRRPISVCIVVDVSGSLSAEGDIAQIGNLVSALVQAIAKLRDGDLLSVVTFSDTARTVVSAQRIDSRSRWRVVQALRNIQVGGGTNVLDGILQGYRELAAFPADGDRRLVLITDGRATVGVTSPREIDKEAQERHVRGVRISALGFGHRPEEKLLREIAQKGKGEYFPVESASALVRILEDELMTRRDPVARKIALTVDVASGFNIREAYGGVLDRSRRASVVYVDLERMTADDARVVIFEVEGKNVLPGLRRPLTAKVVYQPVGSSSTTEIEATASIYWHKDGPGREVGFDRNAARNATLLANALAFRRMADLAEEGRLSEAVGIADLQIHNNRTVRKLERTGVLDDEIERLAEARDMIAGPLSGAGKPVSASPSPAAPVDDLARLAAAGADMAKGVIPGIWVEEASLLSILAR